MNESQKDICQLSLENFYISGLVPFQSNLGSIPSKNRCHVIHSKNVIVNLIGLLCFVSFFVLQFFGELSHFSRSI